MTSLRISEVTEQTGVPATALRFYEKVGIVVPARTENGYRAYSPSDIARLEFVVRAKAVGLSLDEATELLALRDLDDCAPVQDRLLSLVRSRMADARVRSEELATFADELAVHLSQLRSRPDGPCDDACGCLTGDIASVASQPVRFMSPQTPTSIPIVDDCSLDRALLSTRLDEWRAALHGSSVDLCADTATVTLAADTDLGTLGALIAAELECCSFFEFRLEVGASGRRLVVQTPASHRAVLQALIVMAS